MPLYWFTFKLHDKELTNAKHWKTKGTGGQTLPPFVSVVYIKELSLTESPLYEENSTVTKRLYINGALL